MRFDYHKIYLPNQLFFRKLFNGSKKKFEEKLYFYITNFLNLQNPKNEFKLKLTTRHSVEEMASPPIALNFYKFICTLIRPKKILEIGTFIGVSSMNFAKASGKNTKITTIEKFDEFREIAKSNFKKNNFSKKIKSYLGDAFVVLNKLKKQNFDLIFLDGDKGKYLDLFKIIEKKFTKKNTMIIIDNFFFHGDTLNINPKTEKGIGVKKLHNYLKRSKKYTITILSVYDGIALLRKK
jgi:caffeoyl-CoA O-methyltransferase